MQGIFIGVDGGGTRLKIYVEDNVGHMLFVAEGGAANIRLSHTNAWQSILTALQQGFATIGRSFPEKNTDYYGSFGLAGAEYQPALDAFLNESHPFKQLIVSSDAKIAFLGAHGKCDGAIIIAGTGIIGYQEENHHKARVGGWGFPHDDIGSGAHLGMQAVLQTFKAFDGRAQSSKLTSSMQRRWPTPHALLLHFHGASSKTYASVVPHIFAAADEGDSIAISLIQKTCEAIYEISHALFKQQSSSDPLPLSLVGGLAKPLAPYLNASFKKRLKAPLMPPEQGALLLLKQ